MRLYMIVLCCALLLCGTGAFGEAAYQGPWGLEETDHTALRIHFPKIGAPLWLQAGAAGELVFESSAKPEELGLSLGYGKQRWPLALEEFSSTDRGSSARFAIPAQLPIGLLYDLHLRHGDAQYSEPNAVYCAALPQGDYDVIQITDLEVRPEDPATGERLARAIQEINLIHPAFVLASGDLTYSGKAAQFSTLKEVLSTLRVPLYCCPGNTEHHGDLQQYYRHINPYQDYAIALGKLELIAMNTGDNYHPKPGKGHNAFRDNRGTGLSEAQLTWLEGRLREQRQNSPTLICMHFPAITAFQNRGAIAFNREAFLALCLKHGVAAVLSGHTHMDAMHRQDESMVLGLGELPAGPLYVQTATTSSSEKLPFSTYHYRRIQWRGDKLQSLSLRNATGQQDLRSSIPVGKLELVMESAENGLPFATVRNSLAESFPKAQVVFSMPPQSPLARKAYRTDTGRIVTVIDTGKAVEVVVEFALLGTREMTLRLSLQ